MNRKQIVLKYLGNIHISDTTMEAVIAAMKESEENYNYLEFEQIDWELLAKQKESLLNIIIYLEEGDPDKEKHTIDHLNGIMELINNLQDQIEP